MIKFSIVIPVFNEEHNIKNLIIEIYNSLKKINNVFEIILVNDGSNDETLTKLENLDKKKYKITLINNKKNFGQSYSIRKGIELSNYENILTIDGDGQNNPNDIPKLIEVYQKKNLQLISGIRYKRKDNFIKKFTSKVANNVRSFILKDNCTDTGCSLKLFKRNIFLKIPYFSGIHRFIPSIFNALNCKINYINVDHRPRLKGVSKYGTIYRLYRGIIDIVKVIRIIKIIKKNV